MEALSPHENPLATSHICKERRPDWKISEIPPTSLSAWSGCPRFHGHTVFLHALGDGTFSVRDWGVRGRCDTLPRPCSLWLPPPHTHTERRELRARRAHQAVTPSTQADPIPHEGTSYLGSAAVWVSEVREGHSGCPCPVSLFPYEFPSQPRGSVPLALWRLVSLHRCECPAPVPSPAWSDWRQSRRQPSCRALRSGRRPSSPWGPEDRRAHGWAGEGRRRGFPRARGGEVRRGAAPGCEAPEVSQS